MFEDFDPQNNQKQEDDDDSETLSYSYPSYSRFTYTGKTKSRLGRSRFMRQTGNKEETKKREDNNSGTSDMKSNSIFLPSNSQAPKTPGVSWLQRDSSLSANSFTPGGNSKDVHPSYSDLNVFPSQSNFLFNLKNDSVQNSSCKRNLPFSTTPFKSKDNQANPLRENQVSALRELNQLLKPEILNPFSKLDFSSGSKEGNKENTGRAKTENVKNSDFDPTWRQLKKICDNALPYPALPVRVSETNEGVRTSSQNDIGRTSELRSSLFAPFNPLERRDEKKKDDDSSNTPLDLSSAESLTSRSLFCRSLTNGSDQFDSDTSESLSRKLKDVRKESIEKADDSATQKTNTDALSGFLPKFLVPKNKNNTPGSLDDDNSTHSIGTVVDRNINIQPQAPLQKSQIPLKNPMKTQVTPSQSQDIGASGNEMDPSFQFRPLFDNDTTKKSPPSLPINFSFKQSHTSLLSQSINEDQASSQNQLQQNIDQKCSPSCAPGSIIALEPPKLSPPSAHSVPDLRNVVNDGQQLLKQEPVHQDSVYSNQHSVKNENMINPLAQNLEENLGIVSKSHANDIGNTKQQYKTVEQLRSVNLPSLNSVNEIYPPNQPETKPVESLIGTMANPQEKTPSINQVQRCSEPLKSVYHSGIKTEARPSVPLESVETNLNQVSLQQANTIRKSAVIDNRDPAMYTRLPENLQPAPLSQKTYLAPQQTLDRNNASDFPHVKPEIPQFGGRPSFPAVKKPNQFKMSVARGMPSRADTELSVSGKPYAILSMLGKGGSSEVYQVLDPKSSKLLAVKCVDLSMVDKTIADGYLNEIDLLSKLQGCASVIRMFDYEYVQECKMLYVVMEKGDTDLSHLIRDISKTKKISMSMIIYYWTEMLQAVKDIHDQGIIHSDLKPANFLLVSGRLKLIDFGIASSQGDMTSVVKEVTTGTWNYMSPEAIKNTSTSGKGFKITYKSDVWSLGCILYNLVYGKTPFSHITNTWGKLTAIADPNHCIEFPDVGAPAVLVKALRSCFCREPKLRPTVAELLSLPYHSSGDSSTVGRQVQALLPTQWWLKVAHLFPEVKTNQEGKNADNAG